MSSTHHAHAYLRTSPSIGKKPAVKGSRFTLAAKTAVSNRFAVKGNKSKIKLEKESGRGQAINEIDEGDASFGEGDQEEMGTTFLQYCAMCEKQIVVPNNSILYCSERCRRRDASNVPAAVPYLSLFNPPALNHHNNNNTAGQDSDGALGPRVRTTWRRQEAQVPSHLTAPRMPPLAHEGKSDLDPSEWKPHLVADRSSSDASYYLGQFHRSSAALHPVRRPTLQTHGTLVSATVTTTTTPSLSHTPATSTSSADSVAGTPYEFVTRPLLPRLDPKYGISGVKSVDLVTPHLPSTISGSTNENHATSNPITPPSKGYNEAVSSGGSEEVSFEKKSIVERSSLAMGSLKKLLEIGTPTGPNMLSD